MTDMVSLKSVLHDELLFDSCLSAPAWQVGVFIGKGSRQSHAPQKVFIEGFADRIKGVYGSLGIERMFDIGLVFFGKAKGLAAMPLERRERKLANEAKELEHMFGKIASARANELGQPKSCPDAVVGMFGKQSKKNSPYLKGQRMRWRATPAFATLEIGHHGIPVAFGCLDSLFIKLAWAVFEVEN